MHQLPRRISLFFIMLSFCIASGSLAMDQIPGHVLVFLEKGISGNTLQNNIAALGDDALVRIMEESGISEVDFIVKHGKNSDGPASRYLILKSDKPNFDPVTTAKALTLTPSVKSASPNYIRQLFVQPNDPMTSTQWHVQLDHPAGISLPQAWDLEKGSPATIIAILDTGVDTGHPDLAGNIWVNSGEIAGNGLDDDGNGYIDDINGWDFGWDDNDPKPHYTPDASGVDVGFHGTHCAGIASAVTDNNVGVAGAGWGCSIMALKLPDAEGNMTDVGMVGGFLYAMENGADVLSMSLGGPDQDGMAVFMQDLIDQALAANIVCVAAAGNNDTAEPMYPGACTGVISVGATDETNGRASFSTYGNWVTVAAPGNRIWSTICRNYEIGLLDAMLYMLGMGYDGSSPYMYSDGTSMACPLVAGVCGLIRNRVPGMSPAQVLDRLVETGDHVAYDQPIGVKINAFAALNGLGLSSAGNTVTPALVLSSYPNPFNPVTNLEFRLVEASQVKVGIYDGSGRLVRNLIDESRSAGTIHLQWNGTNDTGARVASGIYFARVNTPSGTVQKKLTMVK